ncbi:MAG TPA: hypothetical protein V6D19_26090 [Stenomitos sp.]
MPKTASAKCRSCAKLSSEEAIAKHGPSGSGCWEGEKCHKRRTYYRNRDRYNKVKRQQYRGVSGSVEPDDGNRTAIVTVVPPVAPAAILHLYRERVNNPLHAIGAELWLGQTKVAEIEPVHTMGLMPAQVKAFLKEILMAFSQQAGTALVHFEVQQERSHECCPIRPCPLHQ